MGRVCDALPVRYDREFYLTYQVHNEAIVIPEVIGAIRALTGFENAEASIEATNRSLGITTAFVSGDQQAGSTRGRGRASWAGGGEGGPRRFVSVGFKGSEEPTDR